MEKWHSLDIKTIVNKLKSAKNGLSQETAQKRLQKYGLNEIPQEKKVSAFMIFLSQFNNSLVYILIFAGILSLFLKAKIDAGVIFFAVLINVIIGFIQENKANKAIAKLRQLVAYKAIVLRDGHEMLVPSSQIVVGDIILIKAGSRIPADARLIHALDLQINEACLTGESSPSHKKTEPVLVNAVLADRENMAYAGTTALNGVGAGIVCAIGKNTEIGKIALLVSETKEEKTPLQNRLSAFSRFLGIIFALICLLIIIAGLAQGRPLLMMIETGVAVGVASIPEGLTVAVTFILALGMQDILKRKALVKKLVAAETLGSITVICTDKTGTLTEGKMQVAHIVIGEKEFEINSLGSRQDEKEAWAVSLALQTAMMCNDAQVENPNEELKEWRFIGTATETALLSAAIQSGLRREELLKIEPKIAEQPFDSDRKYMLSLHACKEGKYILYEKGAPERLLAKAGKFIHLGNVENLSAEEKCKLNLVYEKLTSRGLRVIGLAKREFVQEENAQDIEKNNINWQALDRELTFIGFIAIKDPLRPEARETIRECSEAGIKTVIITGDHKLTAKAIAAEAGLKVKAENIVTGDLLDTWSDEKLTRLAGAIDVYARVSPHHKLRIVKALRARGEVVAMTGDGINDSPALKAADIGIALGTGTDVAKETADMVLLDNNFKTIAASIKQGRVIFKNIRKVITFLIGDSFSEMILVIGSILFNAPLALLPAQILWINIINDALPHFSLAFEKEHGTIMQEKPLPQNEPLLNAEMKKIIYGVGIGRDIAIFALFYFLWRKSAGNAGAEEYLRTLMFAILGVKSLITIFSLRSFTTRIWHINHLQNLYMPAAVAASFGFLLCGIYLPFLQRILGTVNLGFKGWLTAFGIGFLSIGLIEIAKTGHIIKIKKSNVRVLDSAV